MKEIQLMSGYNFNIKLDFTYNKVNSPIINFINQYQMLTVNVYTNSIVEKR